MKKILLVCILGIWGIGAVAQDANGFIRCLTDEKLQEHLTVFPEIKLEMDRHEAEYLRQLADGKLQNSQRAVRTIPVVVHIIQQTSNEEVSDARVQTQIDVLNEDFRKLPGTPGNGNGVDYEIEFKLAQIDPNGCPTNGINRLVNGGLAQHDSNNEFQLKSLIQWPPTKYLNMWVPKTISGGILGYATFPTSLPGAPFLDGVVLNSIYFGRGEGTPATAYNLGRTATHEVGHWLGLYHTFQGGCAGTNASNCASAGDRVCDTPPTSSANYGCPNSQNTCTETPTDLPDQTRNYMDYVNDNCMDVFTAGQKARTESFMLNQRAILWSATNLTATGTDGTTSPGCVPVVDFQADMLSACLGANINFSDLTIGIPTAWEWSFSGGTPASSTQQNPTILYSEPGIYPVSLTATNSLGTDSKTQNGYITVREGLPTPVYESFESILFYPLGWTTIDEDGLGTWELSNIAGSEGTKSMVVKNYDYNGNGTKDQIQTSIIDLRYTTSASLEFDYSYKLFNQFRLDSFRVKVTDDCGISYTTEFEAGGTDLATVSGLSIGSAFVPSSPADWKTQTIDLADYLGSANVRVVFECVGRNGQYLYIDRLNITAVVDSGLIPVPVDTSSPPAPSQWKFTPVSSPFTNTLIFQYEIPKEGTITFEIFDLSGNKVYKGLQAQSRAGIYLWKLPEEFQNSLKAGIYIYQAKWNIEATVGKFIRDSR